MPSDSLAELTELLHRAYAPLAQRGLRYVATYQDESTTARRIAGGTCLVATLGNRLVGTITFKPGLMTTKCDWYQRPGVAYCGQFGISPDHQGLVIGSLLMDLVEQRAWSTGAQEIALDTSDQAEDLIAWYRRRRYRPVGEVDWEVTNYRSVVLSKNLALPGVTFRDLSGSDGDLVASLLVETVNWNPHRPRIALPDLLAQPTFSRYVDGWAATTTPASHWRSVLVRRSAQPGAEPSLLADPVSGSSPRTSPKSPSPSGVPGGVTGSGTASSLNWRRKPSGPESLRRR